MSDDDDEVRRRIAQLMADLQANANQIHERRIDMFAEALVTMARPDASAEDQVRLRRILGLLTKEFIAIVDSARQKPSR